MELDYVLIGAHCCGTTSLYSYITSHPGVEGTIKEPNYFNTDRYDNRPLAKYMENFHNPALKHIEGTVGYFDSSVAYKRVAQHFPNAKLIAMVRNPIDRAQSSYWERPLGNMKTFYKQIGAWPDPQIRSVGHCSNVLRAEIKADVQIPTGHVRRGIYVYGLQNWLSLYPREQLLIIKGEDMFKDPERTYHEVLAFLGLPEHSLDRYKKHARHSMGKIAPDVRRELIDFYRPYNKELYNQFGIKWSEWDE